MARGNSITRRGDIFRFDPWAEFEGMRRNMDVMQRLMGFNPNSLLGSEGWAGQPNVDIYETQDEVVFSVELPGFDKEDIDLNVTADTLQLIARHREDTGGQERGNEPQNRQGESVEVKGEEKTGEEKGKSSKSNKEGTSDSQAIQASQPQHPRTYHVQGIQRRSFVVNYALPTPIDPNKVSAKFQNGILEVHMSKPEQSKPKQVKVDVQ